MHSLEVHADQLGLSATNFVQWELLSDEDTEWTLLYHQWYPQRFLLPIPKLHSILAVSNLLTHNNLAIS